MSERFAGLARAAGRFAVCCRDLSNIDQCGDSDCRPDEFFPAASVIKAAIMACLLEDAAQGRTSLQKMVSVDTSNMVGGAGVLFEMAPRSYALSELCRLMMVVSDNTASNACLREVGMERFNEFCRRRGYQAEIERYFMSPVVDGRDNRMTAASAAKILADLYGGLGLTSELREFAVESLRRQQYREKIPLMLPPEVVVGHKTGELDGVRHDAAVIEVEQPYALVVLTAQGGAPWEVDKAIAELSLSLFRSKVTEVYS